MKIFLDDIRHPTECINYMYHRIGALNPIYNEEWLIVKNFMYFQMAIINAVNNDIKITHISFDHDLADEHCIFDNQELDNYNNHYKEFKEKTGYDCAKWLKEFYKERNLELPVLFVHSMNPVGTQNIINVFK